MKVSEHRYTQLRIRNAKYGARWYVHVANICLGNPSGASITTDIVFLANLVEAEEGGRRGRLKILGHETEGHLRTMTSNY